MVRRATGSSRTDTLCPYTPLFRSEVVGVAAVPAAHGAGGERQFGVHHHARGIEELRDAQAVAAAACADGGVEGEQARLQFRQRVLAYRRSEEHTSELQSLMRISYAVFCLNTNIHTQNTLYYTSYE